MVIVTSTYLGVYNEVRIEVSTFLPTPTQPQIPCGSDFTALVKA
jgi:hypothetical protein